MSYTTTPIYPRLLLIIALPYAYFRCFYEFIISEMPLLNFSRMVRPGGRGRGGNDPPPLPDYMAAMMQ